jgi:hypothetical protein
MDIDLTDWHTYEISWKPDEATFLIDGEVVAITDTTSNTPVRIVLEEAGLPVPRCNGHLVPLERICLEPKTVLDESCPIQVDYIRIFITNDVLEETYCRADEMIAERRDLLPPDKEHNVTYALTKASEAWANEDYNSTWTYLWQVIWTYEMPELIEQAEDALRSMESMGFNITTALHDYERVLHDWWSGNRLHHWDLSCLSDIIAWHDIHLYNLFARARDDIEAARERGEDTQRLECYYSAAQDAWGDGQYATPWRAENFLDMIPEPTLLPLLTVLGLILLPALPRRR